MSIEKEPKKENAAGELDLPLGPHPQEIEHIPMPTPEIIQPSVIEGNLTEINRWEQEEGVEDKERQRRINEIIERKKYN